METCTQIGRRGCIGTLVISVFLCSIAFAADQKTNLYQSRCSPCHGRNGEGKPSKNVPSLVSDEAKKLSDNQIRELIVSRANGEMERNATHTLLKKRLTDDQVHEIIKHIRKMQRVQH
ncbi:MAG TPA: c-type cytochrome [Terriglobales bacterium]|jgi:cytochrome c553|nr:c-type cytochrome [Terriglobales bacterium]